MMLRVRHADYHGRKCSHVQAWLFTATYFSSMDTCFSPTVSAMSPGDIHPAAHEAAQPYIYSFRCSQGMEESLTRLMRERGLNRTSVIRLALYALDCISRRQDVGRLSLAELVAQLEALAPDSRMSFGDFIRGTNPEQPATAPACGGWIPPDAARAVHPL